LFGTQQLPPQPMSAQERSVRLNVMRATGTRVQELTRYFRTMQREFLARTSFFSLA
jgi:hypothetical protein